MVVKQGKGADAATCFFFPTVHFLEGDPMFSPTGRRVRAASAASSTMHLQPIALVVLIVAGATAPQVVLAQTEAARAPRQQAVVQRFDIPAGPLEGVLNRLGREAGVLIGFGSAVTEGLRSNGVSGSLTVQDALSRALASTGLGAVRSAGGGYALNALPASAAGPADADAATTLSAVTVSAQAERSAVTEGSGSYAAAGPSTAATRLALTARETPQSVSVVTRQQIEDRGFQSLEDVALDATGLSTRQIGGGERTQFFSRGFEVNSFLADGVPLAFDYDTQGLATLAMYDRIEIIRGAAGIVTGTGNPSGTINLVRKRPTATPQVSLTASAGSWENYRGEIDAGGPLNEAGTLRGRAVIASQSADTFKKAYSHQRDLLYGTLEVDLGRDTTLSLGGYFNKEDNPGADWNGLPTRRDGSFYPFARSTRLTPNWAYWNKRNASVFAELEHRFDGGWKTKVTARALQAKMDMLGTYLYPLDDATFFGQGVGAYAYKKNQYSIDGYAQGPFQWLGRTHELVFGGSYRKNRDDDGPGGWPSDYDVTVDPMNWNSSAVPRPVIDYLWSRKGHQTQAGLYGTARFSVSDPLTLMLGARVDAYRYQMHLTSGTWNDDSAYKVSHKLTPYAGLVYNIGANHSIYASGTSVFQPQSNQNSQGAVLAPVTGTNMEIGIKGEYLGGRLNASAAVFQIDQKNLPLQLAQYRCQSAAASCYAQAGEVRSRGVEFEVAGALTPDWQVMAGYTYNSAQFVRDSDAGVAGTRYDTQTPRHLLKLSTSYRLPGVLSAWRVGGALRTRSETSTTFGVRQGGYTLIDLMASYAVNRHLDIRLNLYNVTDKYYYQTIGSTQDNNHFGTPRNALLTVNYKY